MRIKKIAKIVGSLILIILFILIYNSVYFDIPKNEIISKHAKGASEFLELEDGSKIHSSLKGHKPKPFLTAVEEFEISMNCAYTILIIDCTPIKKTHKKKKYVCWY